MWVFLNECYKIEKLAAKVYRKFAENPNYPDQVRKLFDQMADEELDHARVIDLVMQTPATELKAEPLLTQAEVDEMLRLSKASLVSAEHSELSAREALQLSLQIEEQLVKVHANNALVPDDEKLETFFNDLSRYDQDHVDKLRSCLTA